MSQVPTPGRDRLDAVIGALLDPPLEPIVDMVLTRDGSDYEARAPDGAVRFRRDPDVRTNGSPKLGALSLSIIWPWRTIYSNQPAAANKHGSP